MERGWNNDNKQAQLPNGASKRSETSGLSDFPNGPHCPQILCG